MKCVAWLGCAIREYSELVSIANKQLPFITQFHEIKIVEKLNALRGLTFETSRSEKPPKSCL